MSYPSSKWDGDWSSSMCYPSSQCLTLPLRWWSVFHLNVLPSQSVSYPPIEMVIGHPPQCVTLPVNILPSQRDANPKNWCLRVLSVDVVDNKLQVLCVGGTVEAGSLQTPARTAVSLVWLLLNSQLSLKMVCMCSGKPIIMNSTSSLRRPPSVYIIGFQCWSDRWWPFFLLGRLLSTSSVYASLLQVVEGVSFFLALCPHVESSSTLHIIQDMSHLWGLLCLSVSSSSTLQIIQDTSHFWGLLHLSVKLLGHYPWLQHFQGSESMRVSWTAFLFNFKSIMNHQLSGSSRRVNKCKSHKWLKNITRVINLRVFQDSKSTRVS